MRVLNHTKGILIFLNLGESTFKGQCLIVPNITLIGSLHCNGIAGQSYAWKGFESLEKPLEHKALFNCTDHEEVTMSLVSFQNTFANTLISHFSQFKNLQN